MSSKVDLIGHLTNEGSRFELTLPAMPQTGQSVFVRRDGHSVCYDVGEIWFVQNDADEYEAHVQLRYVEVVDASAKEGKNGIS